MKCARCPSQARGYVEIGQVRYALCNFCANRVENSAANVVTGLKQLFRNQKHVQKMWERV